MLTPITLAAYGSALLLLAARSATGATIPLSLTPPENLSQPVLDSFVSFSIEFSSFPDFAGESGESVILISVRMENNGRRNLGGASEEQLERTAR